MSVSKPLSDSQIKRAITGVTVAKYGELPRLLRDKSLLSCLPLVVLYETSHNNGHWVLVHETPEGVEHFDSYSIMPDQEFKFIGDSFRDQSGQGYPLIVKLLLDLSHQGMAINFNEYVFQSSSPAVATCGRWCILREWLGHKTIGEFRDSVFRVCDFINVSPDKLVTMVVDV